MNFRIKSVNDAIVNAYNQSDQWKNLACDTFSGVISNIVLRF